MSSDQGYVCVECGKRFQVERHLFQHEQTHTSTSKLTKITSSIGGAIKNGVRKTASAFKNRIVSLQFENMDEKCLFPEEFMRKAWYPLKEQVELYTAKYDALKFNIELFALYLKLSGDEHAVLEEKSFKTKMIVINYNDKFDEIFLNKQGKLCKEMEEFQERDSGWTLIKLLRLQMNISKFQPLKGSSFIPLPRRLAARKAIINIQNSDEFCFKWAVVAAFSNIENNCGHPSSYKVDISSTKINVNGKVLKFEGLSFPLKLKDITLFEKMNEHISINVFGYDDAEDIIVGPYYKAEQIKAHHLNLLFLQKHIDGATIAHYAWIKNMSR